MEWSGANVLVFIPLAPSNSPSNAAPSPPPSPLQNEYAGINFIDTYHRKGLYPRDFPFVGGQEGGGVVAETTPKAEADGVKVGDRVAYSVFGSYAEVRGGGEATG